ncbi:MAG TPA: monovalent cation/H(+) antiporter subunit G [Jatrophihabitantaceae bacterium]|jgi:multicomponent Na+:H+ antiporter subunit G|nr:monovalent cation/H(+) antiporter subunit G [Jatrophihabitantaceae bacterium]
MTIAVIVLCAIGLFFSLSGAVGILRMPDVYTRIQCSSKVITMGALPLLVALAIAEGPVTEFAGRALFVGFFTLVLSPAATHALARSSYKTGVPMWKGSVLDEPRQLEQQRKDQQP